MILPILGLLLSCNGAPSKADLDSTRGSRVDVYFNDPGARLDTIWRSDAVAIMIELIDSSQATLDFAVMGFSHVDVVDAMIRAYDRGVQVRMVGDSGHLYNSGYKRLIERHIPVVTGNDAHIMHDKFMIVDGRFLFAATANWTPTDLEHNSNNFVSIDSPFVCADFQAEFDQMWDGAFGHQKVHNDNGRVYNLGDTEVEVWFSPNEDAMGRILELVDAAEESVRFTIFAFTKDQVGSAFIRKQEEFVRKDLEDGISLDADFRDRRSVAGVIDQSQLHSNGQYHEVYRLLGAEIPLRMDGNDASKQPGDYQAGGGRLHSKTMVLDAYGENPVVITGSFNWSASATQSNDEFLMVFKGPRIAQEFDGYFEYLYKNGRRMGRDFIDEEVSDGYILKPGDITINEIMWYGAHLADVDGFDEFIELKNHTPYDIELDLWQLSNPDDFVLGFPPGSTIPGNGLFTVVDHVVEAYQDGAPQDQGTAYTTGDLVVNAFNDNRQARLYLKDSAQEIFLLDPEAKLMDTVGDGGPPFGGGPNGYGGISMERLDPPGDGADPSSWADCVAPEGGINVNPALIPTDIEVAQQPLEVTYKEVIIATPGEPNSRE